MNRSRGISILSVLSLAVGLLVAEYAFAPLRDPYYPTTDKPSQSDAGSSARPTEADPAAPASQSQHAPLPVEHRHPVVEAEGDPMYVEARPVIDAVWQAVSDASPRVPASVVGAAVVGGEPVADLMASNAFIAPGGAFFGTQRTRRSAAPSNNNQGATLPTTIANVVPPSTASDGPAGNVSPTVVAAVTPVVTPMVTNEPPNDPIAPDAVMALNDAPSAPVTDAGLPSAETPSVSETPAPSPTTILPPDKEEMAAWIPVMPEDVVSSVPQISVPEPSSGSLLLIGILFGALSRRHRRPA